LRAAFLEGFAYTLNDAHERRLGPDVNAWRGS
jgi:hypothetical protein